MLFYIFALVLFALFCVVMGLLLKRTAENDRLTEHNNTLQDEILSVSQYAQEMKTLKEVAESELRADRAFEIAYVDLWNECCNAFGLDKAALAKKPGRGNAIIIKKLKEIDKA